MSVKSRLFLSWTFYGCDLGIPEESLRIGVESSWRCACTYLQVRIQLQWVGNLKLNFSDDSRCWKFTTNKVWNTCLKKQLNIMIFVEDGNGLKQIFMILFHIMSMLKQQEYTCDWIVNEWMYSVMLLHCVNIWWSRESDEKRPISNFPKLSESKLFCLRARLSTLATPVV